MIMQQYLSIALTIGAIAASADARQQPVQAQAKAQPYSVTTGVHRGSGEEHVLAFETTIAVEPGTPWINLRFDAANLGQASYITLFALEDGGFQIFNTHSLHEWNMNSAYFNGSDVLLQLWVAPQDSGVFVQLFDVLVGQPPEPSVESLCGADNRSPLMDNRVCRVSTPGCTAWRATNGAFLTAGHCVDRDPDGIGPQLPDGIVDLSGNVEFNVPASNPDGGLSRSAPEDQYPIDPTYVVWRYDGVITGSTVGADWGVFGVNANSNTGLLPHEAYGFPMRMTHSIPAVGDAARVTGFGADSTPTGSTGGGNTNNRMNQTATGDFLGQFVVSPDQIYQSFLVDMTVGSSGSPIIWSAVDAAIGINTSSDCDGSSAANHGTSLDVDPLEAAIEGFTGPNVRFCDVGHALAAIENGTIFEPYDTLVEAMAAVPTGGIVSMVAGNYTAAAGNVTVVDRQVEIEATAGTVVIGN